MTDRVNGSAPLPMGVRDILPVECCELRALGDALSDTFSGFGYREVMTPLIELADVLDRAQEGGLGRAYRLFDDHGRVLVIRPDLTIPVARLVATRMADHPGPVRVSYTARAVRPPAPGRADPAEQRQAGIELVGLSGPAADAEVIAALSRGLAAAGLADVRVAIGSVSLVAAVIRAANADGPVTMRLWAALKARSLVAWRAAAAEVGAVDPVASLLSRLPSLRGGSEVLDEVAAAAPSARDECERLTEMLRVVALHGIPPPMVDLGLMRDWSYYSGVVIEAYAPGLAAPVAVGGRYDALADRFGRPRPAVGVAVALDLLHRAVMPSQAAAARAGVVLVGGADTCVPDAAALRARGIPVVALPGDHPAADEVAAADGWSHVARTAVGGGWDILDVVSGAVTRCASLEEGPWA